MVRRLMVVVILSLVTGLPSADTFTVRNTKDSGSGSLRRAITRANTNAGADNIVFRPDMAGKIIRPATALPEIEDNGTSIDGDINGDGAPDIALNGSRLGSGRLIGVGMGAKNCTIAGLVFAQSPGRGITLVNASYVTVRSCHIGVNLAGTKPARNGDSDIYITMADHVTIGGASPDDRNIIAGGATAASSAGIEMDGVSDISIIGNCIGLRRDGAAALGGGHCGISVFGVRTVIGGLTSGERNLFGGLEYGLILANADDTTIAGNYFGLAANGNTGVSIAGYCIWVRALCTGNLIGGTAVGARNVFAGNALTGVLFDEGQNEGNKVQGNYFGCNAAGTRQRRLRACVAIEAQSPQVVGGNRVKAGNYFTPKSAYATIGVAAQADSTGTLIRYNKFGRLPNGKLAPTPIGTGVKSWGATVDVLDNAFARAGYAVAVETHPANPRVFRNTFLRCDTAVWLEPGARCRLGNLGNTKTSDDGGNRFRLTQTWHVRNETGNRILAEGNDFGTTSRSAIDANIWDRRDDASLGRVDFNPLIGSVLPTGTAEPALAVTGTAAVATRAGGAEVVFSLSAPADVTVSVLNIAGRPVATVARDRACKRGTQRVLWTGKTDRGTACPTGLYVVRVGALGDDGQQASAISVVRLER